MMANTAASQADETRTSTARNVRTAMSVEASRMVPTVTVSPDNAIRSWRGRISSPERTSNESMILTALSGGAVLVIFVLRGRSLVVVRRLRNVRAARASCRTITTQYPPMMIPTHSANVTTAAAIDPSSNCFDVLEHVTRQLNAKRRQALAAFRADAGRPESPAYLPVTPQASAVEYEDVLHRHDVTFHAGDFGNARDLARPV